MFIVLDPGFSGTRRKRADWETERGRVWVLALVEELVLVGRLLVQPPHHSKQQHYFCLLVVQLGSMRVEV